MKQKKLIVQNDQINTATIHNKKKKLITYIYILY